MDIQVGDVVTLKKFHGIIDTRDIYSLLLLLERGQRPKGGN